MSIEKEMGLEITPEEVFERVMNNRIDYFNINICNQDSSLEVIGEEKSLLDSHHLDYNGWLINSFRFVLQSLPEHQMVRTTRITRGGVSITRELEIKMTNGEHYQAVLISAGISNKFNYLKFWRK